MYEIACFIIMFSQKKMKPLKWRLWKKSNIALFLENFPVATKKEWSFTNDIPPNIFIISVWLIATPDNQTVARFSKNIVLNEHFEGSKQTF